MKEGTKVAYITHNKIERGIVKSACLDRAYVFVVYNCNNDWENYKNYTAVRTRISDLTIGWDPYLNILEANNEDI